MPGLVLAVDDCPIVWTQRIVAYLADQSARRCGPCLNGLPALATALWAIDDGGGTARVEQLSALVAGRGACAHPDGTVRLVRSLLAAYPQEVDPRRRLLLVDQAPRRTTAAERGVVSRALRVDRRACKARGLCHELLPEVVELDEWGYPVVLGDVTDELVALAREAVRMCPRLALRLVET